MPIKAPVTLKKPEDDVTAEEILSRLSGSVTSTAIPSISAVGITLITVPSILSSSELPEEPSLVPKSISHPPIEKKDTVNRVIIDTTILL